MHQHARRTDLRPVEYPDPNARRKMTFEDEHLPVRDGLFHMWAQMPDMSNTINGSEMFGFVEDYETGNMHRVSYSDITFVDAPEHAQRKMMERLQKRTGI